MKINGTMAQLHEMGYALLERVGQEGLDIIANQLGEIIYITDVKVNLKNENLVTSNRALGFHTDHPKADYVAWICIRSSKEGGETVLADARAAYLKLSPIQRQALSSIYLFEHKVFANDEGNHPLVKIANGVVKIYYSFWLVREHNLSPLQKESVTRFHENLPECKIAEFKMLTDDVLVVDNGRILHGRHAFSDPKRFLKRYWITRYPSSNLSN